MSDWKAIPGFRFYEASKDGRIRSVARLVPCGRGLRMNNGRILKPWLVKRTGYLQVMLSDRKAHSVHRLVAAAFHGAPGTGLVVNHKNGNREDNRAINLEWVSQGENMRHAFRELGARRSCLGKLGGNHPASKPVISREIGTGVVVEYASAMDAVRDGFDSGCISRCCKGQSRSHKGRVWSFGAERGVRWGDERAYREAA